MLPPFLNTPAPGPTAAPQDQPRAGNKGEDDGFGKTLSSLNRRESKLSSDSPGNGRLNESRDDEHNSDEEGPGNRRISISSAALMGSGALKAANTAALADGKMLALKSKSANDMGAEAGDLEKGALAEAKLSGKMAAAKKKDAVVDPLATKGETDQAAGEAKDEPEAQATATSIEPDVKTVLSLLTGQDMQALNGLAQAAGLQKTMGRSDTNTEKTSRGSDRLDMAQLAAAGAGKGEESSDALSMPGQVEGGSGRTFHLASQRSGASMDMTISTASDGKARFDVTRGGNGSSETVTVLDARRFLGFNLSNNAASLTSAMTNEPEWTSAMHPSASLSNAASQSSTGNVVNTLKLQMTPHDLGMVTATLKLTGDQLTVHLTVETRAAHNQLSQDSSGILDALRSQGFTVDQVSVSITPSPQASDGSSQGGDLGQRGAALGQQGSGGQGQSGRSGSSFNSGMDSNDHVSDSRVAAAGGDARSDDIYL